tara:strand:- start:221 stop:826 length:606 start_codon:yes stop_codon:yes gene_type:complete
MALIPKINICVNSKCTSIDVYEETSPYHVSTNPGGWKNSSSVAANIDTSQITEATLTIFDHTGVTLHTTVTLTSVYAGVAGAPEPGRFLAASAVSFTQGDGVYRLKYKVVGNSTTFHNSPQYELITCGIESCLDSLKGKIATECDSKTIQKTKENIDQIELILYGIQTAFSCSDFVTATSLIASAKTICDNLCDCGCGDCS